jgi:hypothetical protein
MDEEFLSEPCLANCGEYESVPVGRSGLESPIGSSVLSIIAGGDGAVRSAGSGKRGGQKSYVTKQPITHEGCQANLIVHWRMESVVQDPQPEKN